MNVQILPYEKNDRLAVSSIDQQSSQKKEDLDKQDRFSNLLWAKVSQRSKECLLANDFVYPVGLNGNYQYFDTPAGTLILDLDSPLGHSRIAKTCFGQNIKTGEFLAFKPIDYRTKVIDSEHQEVVAMRNLGRLRGVVCHEGKEIVYMAMELIDGVTLSHFFWNDYYTELEPAFHLAISYLKERQFLIDSKVVQSDTNSENIMVDVIKEKVFIIDFGGLYVFDHQTKSFTPFPLDSFINIIDIDALKRLFPHPLEVREKDPLKHSFETFLVELEQMKEKSTTHPQVFGITLEAVLQLLENKSGKK